MKSKPTILLIDDDAAFLRSLHIALTTAGYTVAAASSPAAAMDYLLNRQHRFDLVITDVQMTAPDGLHVLAMIKQSFPGIPVIVVSAFGRPGIREQATQFGAFAFLDKPFSKQEIVALIERATQPEARHA